MQDPYLFIFALLGWGLTLYFGFFRYRQYQWTRRKVQYDLFTKINQRSDQLFLKVTTLSVIRDQNEKVTAKHQGVLHKYLEGWCEKILLIRSEMVPQDVALFWLNGMVRELQILGQQHPELPTELAQQIGEVATSELDFEPLFALYPAPKPISSAALSNLLQSFQSLPSKAPIST
ncbi:MAG: hypothetical protein AAF828_08610 [Bacteroidota bacterium]